MKFSFTQMTEDDAREILGWRYDRPYDHYNSDPADLETKVQELIDPQNCYFALRNEDGGLIGYYCFGGAAQVEGGDYAESAMDMSGGVRPEMTGSGFGATFMQVGIDFGGLLSSAEKFRVTVASSDKRALKMCESSDFRIVQSFRGPEDREFVVLVRDTSVDSAE